MQPLILVGSSGHARVIADIVKCGKQYRIVGLVDDYRRVGESEGCYEILGRVDDIEAIGLRVNAQSCVIAIGDNWNRARMVDKILKMAPGFSYASVFHPGSVVAKSATLGEGTVVMPGAVIGPGCKIGRHCIINTGASADHDCVLGDYSSLAPGAVLGGGVLVGDYAAVSIGSTVIQRIAIGANTVVGAGAVVTRDLPEKVLAYGVPAKVIRSRSEGEKYL